MSITRHSCVPTDIDTWDASDAPSTEASPIFIVAFPRSGTTLLELTLDAHPKLKSMDEQPFLHQALDDLLATGHDYPSDLGAVLLIEGWGRHFLSQRMDIGFKLLDPFWQLGEFAFLGFECALFFVA